MYKEEPIVWLHKVPILTLSISLALFRLHKAEYENVVTWSRPPIVLVLPCPQVEMHAT